jgi:biotin synthase-like enzyme
LRSGEHERRAAPHYTGALALYAARRMDRRYKRDPRSSPRNDWTREDIAELFDLPFTELVYRAAQVHRENHPANEVQLSTLLSIKTGGCVEDCGYCSQSVKADSGSSRPS